MKGGWGEAGVEAVSRGRDKPLCAAVNFFAPIFPPEKHAHFFFLYYLFNNLKKLTKLIKGEKEKDQPIASRHAPVASTPRYSSFYPFTLPFIFIKLKTFFFFYRK